MPQLRHLMIKCMTMSPISCSGNMVGEARFLENLQTLESVENFICTEQTIEMIPNLKKLKATYRDCKSNKKWQHYCLNNLVHLCQLETLGISFYLSSSFSRVELFPESFSFPRNPKKLSLRGCKLPWEDLRVVGSLPNLEVLKLQFRAMVGEEWELVEGEFLRLKSLQMRWLDLKYWRAENTHFPTLEYLEIKRCLFLEEIPLEIGESPTLELIEVYHSTFAVGSAVLIQDEQRSLGNGALQVRVYNNFW
ncbi:hypothetical protein BUALT_Bualt02G0104900 [Buddleja alternifolia]|uniref:Uncharacterized protein n=1 Tax=Buddleja alternifolia TaxID=168488 RepID=A0AAV6Y748_9LAMI|nr:hypothetical protein BUALT_Bualt02G0104900 [Buddleja alternifolia]